MIREHLHSIYRLASCLILLLLAVPTAASAAPPILGSPVDGAHIEASESVDPGGGISYAAPVTFTFSGAPGRAGAMLVSVSGSSELPTVIETSPGQYAAGPVSLARGTYSWQATECGLAVDTVNDRCLSMGGQTNDASVARSFAVVNPSVPAPVLAAPASGASILASPYETDTGGIGYDADVTLAFSAAAKHGGTLRLRIDDRWYGGGDTDGTIREIAAGNYELRLSSVTPGAHSWQVFDCALVGAASNDCAGSPSASSSVQIGFTVAYPPARVAVVSPRALVSVGGVPIQVRAVVQRSAPGAGKAGVRISLLRGGRRVDTSYVDATLRGTSVAFNPSKPGRYDVVVSRDPEGDYKGWTKHYAVMVAARQPKPRIVDGVIELPRGSTAATVVRVKLCGGTGATSIVLADSLRQGSRTYPGRQHRFLQRQRGSCEWHRLRYSWGGDFDDAGGIGTYKVVVSVTDAYGQKARSRSFSKWSGD